VSFKTSSQQKAEIYISQEYEAGHKAQVEKFSLR
jgi:hypothetical protein